MRLKDKVALVTGASQGLGLAIARRFCLEGALVFVGDIKEEQGRTVAAELVSEGGCCTLSGLGRGGVHQWREFPGGRRRDGVVKRRFSEDSCGELPLERVSKKRS
jgi:NAD(P)-dependent dehydrogenase (short-subunit alcohol dehydrogenase family)